MKRLLEQMFLPAALALFFTGCTGPRAGQAAKIKRFTYHGWPNAIRMTSEHAEVVVVPQIGRIMSFRLLTGENVFWEDCTLDGKSGDASGKEWVNFGGDKTWPAPEAEWGKYTGRKQWMPPAAFDSSPVQASITNHQVILTSPVDPHYGVRTVRRVQLQGNTLRIDTTYERVSGEASKIGIWVITQFKDPVAVFGLIPRNTIFTNGYFDFNFTKQPWTHIKNRTNHFEVTRDPKSPRKLGSDAEKLIWVGEKETCVVTAWREAGAEYPDRGASAEVYTNPDPKRYVELEMLGPLSLMKPGDRISHFSTYSLNKRQHKNPESELLWLSW
jgi:hypothetical protein